MARSNEVEMNKWCTFVLMAALMLSGHASAQAPRVFASAEDAAKVLIETVKTGQVADLAAIFGAEGKELIDSSDPATARQNRRVFRIAIGERWHLEDAAPNQKTLIIGNEDWPFPVPIVKADTGWRFDAAAGKEEVIARRIGRNELAAIATMHAYATAQKQYAARAHDGNPAGRYAAKFASDAGKENGLYWPAKAGEPRSPLGDLVAQASAEGRTVSGDRSQPSPFHGYYFKIVTARGSAAPGGAIAWPAEYDVTGVMTFVVNHDGAVHEKDLGPGTDAAARKITAYNPDKSWRKVQ
jgi:hypothetical protein